MYLPKSKYKVTTALPNQYLLNGKEYVGPMITTYLGETYAGTDIEHIKGQLVSLVADQGTDTSVKKAYKIKRVPTEEEYTAGKMTRYFKQDNRTKKIIEILPDQYSSEVTESSKIYKYITIEWTLTSKSLEDNILPGGVVVPGVRTKNQEAINKANTEMPGIVSSKVLYDPTQFFRKV